MKFVIYVFIHIFKIPTFAVTESDVYKKLVKMETLAETRLKAISVLEAQKFDLVQGKYYQ